MRDPRKEERLLREVQKAQLTAAARVRGLFRKPDEPGYNPDAASNWQDCTTQTRAALILVQGALATERARQQAATPKVFGMVLMQGRIPDVAQWEQMATDVAEGKAIEAVAVPALPEEGDTA